MRATDIDSNLGRRLSGRNAVPDPVEEATWTQSRSRSTA